MPTKAEEWDWSHRYHRDAGRPVPGEIDIDQNWCLVKSVANPDGGFNGGIDLVISKVNKELAVRKRLRSHPLCAEHDNLRWRREMLILRKLSHENIPYYIDGFYTLTRGSMYMQPCRLGSISDFVLSGRKALLSAKMQEFFLWYVLHEVAQAVLYMQTGFKNLADANRCARDRVKGWVSLVHGDIRPDQIFMNNTESDARVRVLLGDFGFSQFIRPWRRIEVHDGPGAKSSSKAPEFPGVISEATDVFALGATAQLYLVSTEKAKSGLAMGWLRKRAGVSHEMDEFVCRCVAVAPSERPSIREVLRMLEWGLAEQTKEGLGLKLLEGPLFKCLYPFPGTASSG